MASYSREAHSVNSALDGEFRGGEFPQKSMRPTLTSPPELRSLCHTRQHRTLLEPQDAFRLWQIEFVMMPIKTFFLLCRIDRRMLNKITGRVSYAVFARVHLTSLS
jgi:hypothetical protein